MKREEDLNFHFLSNCGSTTLRNETSHSLKGVNAFHSFHSHHNRSSLCPTFPLDPAAFAAVRSEPTAMGFALNIVVNGTASTTDNASPIQRRTTASIDHPPGAHRE